jgi:hypothetical protein
MKLPQQVMEYERFSTAETIPYSPGCISAGLSADAKFLFQSTHPTPSLDCPQIKYPIEGSLF